MATWGPRLLLLLHSTGNNRPMQFIHYWVSAGQSLSPPALSSPTDSTKKVEFLKHDKKSFGKGCIQCPQMLCLIPLLNTLCICKSLCKPCNHLWDPRQDVPLLCIPWVDFPSTKASFYFILWKYKHGFDLFIQSNLPSPLKVPWKCQKCSFKVLDPNQDHTLLCLFSLLVPLARIHLSTFPGLLGSWIFLKVVMIALEVMNGQVVDWKKDVLLLSQVLSSSRYEIKVPFYSKGN